MAMDREKLLAYFQAHYLSRQEVLFKLPLNISIDSFWPELLNRRKARAQLLPLYNASGMPYWYVLTDRMIAASERLCTEAIGQDDAFDPYRAGMTSAMTEEMFFTSFVEGAQIPLQEAMDFLQRGTEPESIQEQMIWNNRRAWAEMTATIYRPLDGNFVRGLAFMLTEEMDDCAEDYRQTDQHPIAAMNSEAYEVPPAYVLPDRMNEYYVFLQKPDIHPLIKAAVAQAYLLVTRPFPEGNERLSRMMSSAVLLRSGYDFFRDISISSVIARESYRYYKCMCEIIRSENGGDLTYFLQYYLELLVRALDARDERQRKREQEAREREQEALRQEQGLARKPLTPFAQPCEEDIIDYWGVPEGEEGTPLPKPPAPAEDEPADAEDVDTADPESPFVSAQTRIMPPVPLMAPDKFLQAVSKMKHSRYPGIRDMPEKVSQMIKAGILRFSVKQWAEITGTDSKEADYECRYMYGKGWMTRTKEDRRLVYAFRIRPSDDDSEETRTCDTLQDQEVVSSESGVAGDGSSSSVDFNLQMEKLDANRSENRRKIAVIIRNIRAQGIICFNRNDWMKLSGMDREKTRDACDYMASHNMIRNLYSRRGSALYVFTDIPDSTTSELTQPFSSYLQQQTVDKSEHPVTDAFLKRLKELIADNSIVKNKRLFEMLMELISDGINTFVSKDLEEKFHMRKTTSCAWLRTALNMGLVCREEARSKARKYVYYFNPDPQLTARSEGLTGSQRMILSSLYSAFKNHHFSIHEGAIACGMQDSSFTFHAVNFAERGILTTERHPGQPSSYAFAINPQENLEFFTTEKPGSTYHPSASPTVVPIPLAAASA